MQTLGLVLSTYLISSLCGQATALGSLSVLVDAPVSVGLCQTWSLPVAVVGKAVH